MDRETRRLIEEYRQTRRADPREQPHRRARRRRGRPRRSSSQRATMFGLGAGTIGLLLSAASARRSLATGRAIRRQGRWHAPCRNHCSCKPARALPPERRRRARPRRHSGRVPDLHEPQGTGASDAGDELEAEQGRDGLDVPAPEGRSVPQRQGDDVGGRRRLDEAVRRKGLERGLRPASSTPAGVSAVGRYAVRFRLKSSAQHAFPYLLSQTTYQAIIQPAAIAAKPGTWVRAA